MPPAPPDATRADCETNGPTYVVAPGGRMGASLAPSSETEGVTVWFGLPLRAYEPDQSVDTGRSRATDSSPGHGPDHVLGVSRLDGQEV